MKATKNKVTKTETVDKLGAYLEIEATKGKIFTACFVKKDGTLREMNCRIGVTKGVQGTQKKSIKVSRKKKGLLAVFDVQSNGWKTVNLYTLRQLRIENRILNVADIVY
jgi:hypothetical protein